VIGAVVLCCCIFICVASFEKVFNYFLVVLGGIGGRKMIGYAGNPYGYQSGPTVLVDHGDYGNGGYIAPNVMVTNDIHGTTVRHQLPPQVNNGFNNGGFNNGGFNNGNQFGDSGFTSRGSSSGGNEY
jgi:hypothetical protein